MNALSKIQQATLAARDRTGDKTIGTQVKQGLLQVVRVVKRAKGSGCDVMPLTDYVPMSAAIAHLDAMQ